MSKMWFTSDTHFYHKNIIKYCARPFKSVVEMNSHLIYRWCQFVRPNDLVMHLGDFALCSKKKAKEILDYLPGTKVLIRGNHDGSIQRNLDLGFSAVYDELRIIVGDTPVMLSHKPLYDCDIPVICGHVHEKWSHNTNPKNRKDIINVGVDVSWNFAPIEEKELIDLFCL